MSANAPEKPDGKFDAWLALTGQVPTPAETVQLPMLSGSMAPAIPVGDLLEIEVGSGAPYRAGDVVVFKICDKLVAHRVLIVLGWGSRRVILEKGDANPVGHWRSAARVRGRVRGAASAADGPRRRVEDPALARRETWRHWKQWLFTLGGRRGAATGDLS